MQLVSKFVYLKGDRELTKLLLSRDFHIFLENIGSEIE